MGLAMSGGFCGIVPHASQIKCLERGSYQRYGNLFIVLFRNDWVNVCWDEYAEVEMMAGLK
jgi:hypothetical protein